MIEIIMDVLFVVGLIGALIGSTMSMIHLRKESKPFKIQKYGFYSVIFTIIFFGGICAYCLRSIYELLSF